MWGVTTSMAKKEKEDVDTKTTKKKEEVPEFNLTSAINSIKQPFIRGGFINYTKNMTIQTQKDFDKLLKEFEGGKTY